MTLVTHAKDSEIENVYQIVDKWMDAWTQKDRAAIMNPLTDDFFFHIPNEAPTIGKDTLGVFVNSEKLDEIPLARHVESKVTISSSGDIAYVVGKHDHILNELGMTKYSPWSHVILLKKVNGVWKICGESETNDEPAK